MKKVNNLGFLIALLVYAILIIITISTYGKLDAHQMTFAYHNNSWDILFSITNNFGEEIVALLLIAIISFFNIKKGVFFLSSLILAGGTTLVLKHLVFDTMNRPKKFFDINMIPQMEGVILKANNSFPSGHTTLAFTTFCVLALLYRKPILGFIFGILAAFGGLARVYLSQHFFQDILAGAIVGTICCYIAYYLILKNPRFDKLNVGFIEFISSFKKNE